MTSKKVSSKKAIDSRLQSRRQFLIGAGSTVLSLPPLLSLMSKKAFAQAMANKKVRYVSALGMLGIDYHQWTPEEQSDLVMIPGQDSMGYKPLANFSGQISRVIDSSFSDLYADMNIISGLSLTGGFYQGHNESVLSGTHSGARDPVYGKSIDVIIEQSPSFYNASNFVPVKAIRMHDNAHLMGFSFDRVNGQRVVSGHLQGDLALFNTLLASKRQIFRGV